MTVIPVSPMPNLDISLLIEDDRWLAVLPDSEALTEKLIRSVLNATQQWPEEAGVVSVSLVLANNDFIQQLNAEYRDKDKPTNVLSFPAYELEPGEPLPSEEELVVGDIIFALETIEAEAKDQAKTLHDHMAHMVIHGMLHLLGYDHIDEADAEVMETLEINLLQQYSIANPYE